MGNQSSKTKLVLIELIIIILFFSLAGAVCVNIFAQARILSVKSTDTTMATLTAQTAAELVRSSDGNELLQEAYEEVDGGFVAYFDAEWDETDEAGAVYKMRIGMAEEQDLLTANISVSKADNELYAITAKKFAGK